MNRSLMSKQINAGFINKTKLTWSENIFRLCRALFRIRMKTSVKLRVAIVLYQLYINFNKKSEKYESVNDFSLVRRHLETSAVTVRITLS